jgi:hypothetical protein
MSEKGNHSAVGGAWCENSRQASQAGGRHRSVEIATGFHFTDAISDDTLKPVRTSGPIVSRRRRSLPSCRITSVAAVAKRSRFEPADVTALRVGLRHGLLVGYKPAYD